MEQKLKNNVKTIVMVVVSVFYLGLAGESYLMGWEFWMPPILLIAMVYLWVGYIIHKFSDTVLKNILFVYGLVGSFYHGIHETSMNDVVVVIVLTMALFSLFDAMYMMNVLLIEYFGIMLTHVIFAVAEHPETLDALEISRLGLHFTVMISMYLFCRTTIRNRKSMYEKQEEKDRKVEENNRDMEDFLSNISHELRTPVNVVNGMSRLFLNKTESEEVEAIRGAGLRLSDQIEDIQDYTEITRGEVTLEEEKYMTMSLIHDVVASFHDESARDDLELIVDLDPQVPSMMRGDIKKIHKLFRHLLSNAIKFTRQGGVYIKVSSIRQEYGVNLLIEVTDTGIGMSRKDMEQVSNGMYQANKKRNRSTGGIGIGLPIVYGMTHRMGGFVKISSRRRVGTTVRISLPQKVVDPEPCLRTREDFSGDIIFFTDPTKYRIPVVREFYKSMAVNLATGLGVRLFSATTTEETDRLLDKLHVTRLFMGQEEYEMHRDYFEGLCKQGYLVAVSVFAGFRRDPGSRIKVMPKPLYGIPIVQILNKGEDYEDELDTSKDRLVLDGVSALIVDDEPMNLVVASGIFREYRMITDTAESGMEALNKYEDTDYDVIFMDHMMPEMDGVDAMKRLRAMADRLNRSPVIIALTANALSGAREMFMREGFDGFIAKPIDIADFERVMKNVLPDAASSAEGRADA